MVSQLWARWLKVRSFFRLDCLSDETRQDQGLSCRGSLAKTCRRKRFWQHYRRGLTLSHPFPCPKTYHSPLADTASLRTSLFLSSSGLANARITCGLYGSNYGVRGESLNLVQPWQPGLLLLWLCTTNIWNKAKCVLFFLCVCAAN